MKGWKSYLLWEGIPFLLLSIVFGFISALNWDYESKLIIPDNGAPDWSGVYMGLILMAMAIAMAIGLALFASSILFIVRITRPKSQSGWYMFASLIIVAIFLIFPGLFIIIMGPAAITMRDQMHAAPH